MDTRSRPGDADELAIQRYRYLLRTAPPEQLEAAHREAFEQLTPEQRRRVLEGLASAVDPSELRNADDSPGGLARLATRAELRQPGTMERAFGGQQSGGGWLGGGFGGSFLGMLAGAFVGTSIANALLPMDVSAAEADAGAGDPADAGAGDSGRVEGGDWSEGDAGADAGGWDGGGEDLGGFGDGGGFDLGDVGF